MYYEVRTIGKWDLPKAQDWALVETEGRTILLVKEGMLTTTLLAEVWAGGRALRKHRAAVAARTAVLSA